MKSPPPGELEVEGDGELVGPQTEEDCLPSSKKAAVQWLGG